MRLIMSRLCFLLDGSFWFKSFSGEGALAGKYHFDEITWAEGVKKCGA